MDGRRRRLTFAGVLLAVLTIGAIPVTHDLLQAAEQEVSIEAYDRTANPGVIVALLNMDQGYVVSRVATTEDATSVVVHVSIRPRRLSWSVGDDTVERQVEVWLDGPLAYRQVIDGHSGNPVPER